MAFKFAQMWDEEFRDMDGEGCAAMLDGEQFQGLSDDGLAALGEEITAAAEEAMGRPLRVTNVVPMDNFYGLVVAMFWERKAEVQGGE